MIDANSYDPRWGQAGEAPAARHRVSRHSWSGLRGSVVVWSAVMAYVFLCKVLLDTFLPNAFSDASQQAIFSWPTLGIIGVAGLAGVWLAHRTGFPGAWEAHIGGPRRLIVPTLLGLVFAIVLIGFDLATGYTRIAAAHFGVERQFTDYPSMFLIFTSGAAIVEVLYRLLPIPLVLWLVSTLALRGRWQEQLFWILAILTSLLEPLSQTPWALRQGLVGIFVFLFAEMFLFNLAQASLFRRYGFLSAILMRAVFYVPWHVLYVH